MLTILSALELSTDDLLKKNVESPRMNAELLLADILGCSRMDLYLKFDQPLSEDEKIKYRDYIKRRGEKEPFQYIIGNVEFYGLKFKVSEAVLIPRPETEILVESVINYAEKFEQISILDIGTGSGNIAISLAYNLKNSKIHSVDISETAVDIAKENSLNYDLKGLLTFEVASIDNYLFKNDQEKFDVIVSNPPYVSVNDYNKLDKELLKFEPRNALTDEKDGFEYYRLISLKAPTLMKPGGRIFFEIGFGQSGKISEIMHNNNIEDIRIKKDYQNIDRVIDGELK